MSTTSRCVRGLKGMIIVTHRLRRIFRMKGIVIKRWIVVMSGLENSGRNTTNVHSIRTTRLHNNAPGPSRLMIMNKKDWYHLSVSYFYSNSIRSNVPSAYDPPIARNLFELSHISQILNFFFCVWYLNIFHVRRVLIFPYFFQ